MLVVVVEIEIAGVAQDPAAVVVPSFAVAEAALLLAVAAAVAVDPNLAVAAVGPTLAAIEIAAIHFAGEPAVAIPAVAGKMGA